MMDEMSWDAFWWSKITGPREIVGLTIEALRSGKSVVIHVPHDLPWRHELRRTVRNDLESVSGLKELIVDTVDIEDEMAEEDSPGQFLLDRYALREDRINYRPGGRESIQAYLLRKDVLRNRLVWVKGFGSGGSREWLRFCDGWSTESVSDGALIVETNEGVQVSSGKYLEIVDYDELVGEYDVQLFNSLVVDGKKTPRLNTTWKKYAASLTSHLCGTDSELAHDFISIHDYRQDDPLNTLGVLADSDSFARRGNDQHALALFRSGDMDRLHRRVWAGQIEVLFPIIERQRLAIVDTLNTQLEDQIGKGLTQFDSPVEKISDIELGTLVYLCSSKKIHVTDYELKSRIYLLRECRNQLAHRDVCSIEQVKSLLDAQ